MVANKANRMVGIIKRTFDFLDEDMLRTLYKALIRPHLEYANCIWSPMLHKDIHLIERVAEKSDKVVTKSEGVAM